MQTSLEPSMLSKEGVGYANIYISQFSCLCSLSSCVSVLGSICTEPLENIMIVSFSGFVKLPNLVHLILDHVRSGCVNLESEVVRVILLSDPRLRLPLHCIIPTMNNG